MRARILYALNTRGPHMYLAKIKMDATPASAAKAREPGPENYMPIGQHPEG